MLSKKTREVIRRLKELYATRVYREKQSRRPEINRLWWYLEEVIADADFDDSLYIVTTVNQPTGLHSLRLIRKAFYLCATLEDIKRVTSLLPASWTDEKAVLLRKIIELASDKEEILAVLQETGYIKP
jgi:hypothetical protein